MKTLALWFLTVTLLMVGGTQGGAGEWSLHQEKYFSLMLPAGFTVRMGAPMMDFEVYTFAVAGTPFIGVYVGNAPKFPRLKASAATSLTTLKAPGFEMVSLWHNDLLLQREMLITMPAQEGWPLYIHDWSTKLPAAQAAIADRILSSLTVKIQPSTPTGHGGGRGPDQHRGGRTAP